MAKTSEAVANEVRQVSVKTSEAVRRSRRFLANGAKQSKTSEATA